MLLSVLIYLLKGKRSWRKEDESSRRMVSNSLFRGHRLSEIREEAQFILDLCHTKKDAKSDPRVLASRILTRLLYFSGGGTTALESTSTPRQNTKSRTIKQELVNVAWLSFGLQSVIRSLPDGYSIGETEQRLTRADFQAVLASTGLDDMHFIGKNGVVDFHRLFQSEKCSDKSTTKVPVDMELGAGYGDWIVHQARCKPERNFVAVELRADRLARNFSKALLSESCLANLCCVGAECGSFLRDKVKKGTISRIFVNHPEPPTQTFGSHDQILSSIANGGDEPGHMLTSSTLSAAVNCLDPTDGQIVIVTDNIWYGRLLCATVVKVMNTQKSIRTRRFSAKSGFNLVESIKKVQLYEGKPTGLVHHVESRSHEGSSYFDKLWKTGAGNHAERSKRFLLVIEMVPGLAAAGAGKK